MIEDTMFDYDCYAVFMEEEHEKEKRVRDNISRQAAIDEIRKCRFVVDAIEKIRGLPSAEPKTGKWIPCSERSPEYDETSEYLITDKDGRVRHCLLDPYMPETFVTVEEGMMVDAVAWRQAPEPYCKTESHEREGK